MFNDFIDNIYGVIFSPGETLYRISKEQKILQGLVVLIVSGILPILTSFDWRGYDIRRLYLEMPQEIPIHIIEVLSSLITYFIFVSIIFALIGWPIIKFLWTAIYQLIAHFFGGNGNGKGLYAAFCFSSFPMIFTAPVNLFGRLTGLNTITFLFSIAIMLWSVILHIISIRENNSLTTGKSVLIYFIPWIVLISLIIMIIVFLLSALIPIISSF